MWEDMVKERKLFFSLISENYYARMSNKHPFLSYFYKQRLVSAGSGLQVKEGSKILDYGAGTGFLYDYLLSDDYSLSNYIGIDISADMLNQSNIPVHQREVGGLDRLKKQQVQDYIFSLGVTTYMTEMELVEFLSLAREKLQKDGSLIISFTNKNSLDFKIRLFFKNIIPSSWVKKQSMGYPFILAYNVKEVEQLLSKEGIQVERLTYLNQTVFPFNKIAPRLAVFIAQRLLSKSRRPFWSSDFLIHASIRPQ